MAIIVIGVGLTIGLLLGSVGMTTLIYLQAQAVSWGIFAIGALYFGNAVIHAVMSIYRAHPVTDFAWHFASGMWCWVLVLTLHMMLPSQGQTVVSRWLMAFLEIPS